MNRKSNTSWVISAIILSAIALIANIVSAIVIIRTPVMAESLSIVNWSGLAVNTIAFVLALVYLIAGYRKSNAVWYKLFVCSFCFALLIAIVSNFGTLDLPELLSKIMIGCFSVMLLLVLIVTLVKDLGRKKTMALTTLNLLLPALIMLLVLIIIPEYPNDGTTMSKIICISFVRFFILSLVLFISAKSKYVDKSERGTI